MGLAFLLKYEGVDVKLETPIAPPRVAIVLKKL